jgi:hypothetical protein
LLAASLCLSICHAGVIFVPFFQPKKPPAAPRAPYLLCNTLLQIPSFCPPTIELLVIAPIPFILVYALLLVGKARWSGLKKPYID